MPKRPRDPNQLGKLIVYLATGAATAETADQSGKDPAAVSLAGAAALTEGRRGRLRLRLRNDVK
jgi:hypothetical protein